MRHVLLALALCATPSIAQTSAPGALRTAVQEAKLLPADGASQDAFGESVSISGDRALIGAYGSGDDGAAYVFVRSGDTWIQEARLTPADGVRPFIFGASVALLGDRAFVGAANGNRFDFSDGGAVYVFVRDADGWSQETMLSAADGESGDYFGWSISADGDRVLIGARFDDGPLFQSGSAYVFRRDGSQWTQEAKLIADQQVAVSQLGVSVSLSGDGALVGAPANRDTGMEAAYVFRRNGSVWTQEARLAVTDTPTDTEFGSTVSLSGGHALIGAPLSGDDAAASGSAYVFERTGTSWSVRDTLTADDPTVSVSFGAAVALDGDHALIGAPGAPSASGDPSGEVYVLSHDGDAWVQGDKLVAADGAVGDVFGGSLSLSRSRALVGAFGDDDNGSLSGSAYVFSDVLDLVVNGERSAEAAPALSAVAPNPVATRARLYLTLAAPQTVRATLHDALGRQLALVFDAAAAGAVELAVDASALPAGVYVVRVTGETFVASRRLTVVR